MHALRVLTGQCVIIKHCNTQIVSLYGHSNLFAWALRKAIRFTGLLINQYYLCVCALGGGVGGGDAEIYKEMCDYYAVYLHSDV